MLWRQFSGVSVPLTLLFGVQALVCAETSNSSNANPSVRIEILDSIKPTHDGPAANPMSSFPNRSRPEAPKFIDYPANRTIVRICYTHDPLVKKGCEEVNKKLEGCGLTILSIFDKAPSEIGDILMEEKLPSNTNVLLSSHGVIFRGNHELGAGPRIGRDPERQGARIRLPNGQIVPTLVSSAEMLSEIISSFAQTPNGGPSVWMSTCHSGAACTERVSCVGAACQADELAMMDLGTGVELTEDYITDLLCDPKKFQALDGNNNGVLETEEIRAGFCSRFGEGKLISKELVYKATEPLNIRWRLPLAAQTIKDESDFQIVLKQKQRKFGAEATVKGQEAGKLYVIEYEDRFGQKQQTDKVEWLDSQASIDQFLKEQAPHWPLDCRDLALGTLGVPPAEKATQCKLLPIGDAYTIAVKDKSNDVCVNSSVRRENRQHPKLNNFRLYSPHGPNRF